MKTKKSAVQQAAPTATQTVPAKTAALAAPAAPKVTRAVTPAPPAKAPASAPDTTTIIDVKHDVGFGNSIFLRGHGGGLNWDHGVPMTCVDGKTWRWSGKVKDPLTFKILINDQIWSAGNDLTVKPGQKVEIKPQFS